MFNCEVVTPMFLAGADGKTPELRPPSIKGALRFWWRATNGHLPIDKLKEKEAKIFGGSGDNEGRSKVIIRVKIKNLKIVKAGKEFEHKHIIGTGFHRKGREIKINILDYIAYGVVQYDKNTRKNLLTRDYLDIGSKFDIIAEFDKKYKYEILSSFYYLFKYGNLGSKARNGFGSLAILHNDKFNNIEQKLKDLPTDLPIYTAFSQKSRLFETKETYSSWDKTLAEISKIYREARLSLESSHYFEERQYISLPLIAKNEKSITSFMKGKRKAKSYFLKVIREGEKYKGRILFLPSVYGLMEDKGKSFKNYDKMNLKILSHSNIDEVNL